MELAHLLEHFDSHAFNDHLDDTLLHRLATSLLCEDPSHDEFHHNFCKTILHIPQHEQGDRMLQTYSLSTWLQMLLVWMKNQRQKPLAQQDHCYGLIRALMALTKRHFPCDQSLIKEKDEILSLILSAFQYVFTASVYSSIDKELCATFLEIWLLLFKPDVSSLQLYVTSHKNDYPWDDICVHILQYSMFSDMPLSQQVKQKALQVSVNIFMLIGSDLMQNSLDMLERVALKSKDATLCDQGASSYCREFLFYYLPARNYEDPLLSPQALECLIFKPLMADKSDDIEREILFLLAHLSHCKCPSQRLPPQLPSWFDNDCVLLKEEHLENLIYRAAIFKQSANFSVSLEIFNTSAPDPWKFLQRVDYAILCLVRDLYFSKEERDQKRLTSLIKNIYTSSGQLVDNLCNKIVCKTISSYATFSYPSDFITIVQYLTVPKEALRSVIEHCISSTSPDCTLDEAFSEAFVHFMDRNRLQLIDEPCLTECFNLLKMCSSSWRYCQALEIFNDYIQSSLISVDYKYLLKHEKAALSHYRELKENGMFCVLPEETTLFLLKQWLQSSQFMEWKEAAPFVMDLAEYIHQVSNDAPITIASVVLCLLITLDFTNSLPSPMNMAEYLHIASLQELYLPPFEIFFNSKFFTEILCRENGGSAEWPASLWMLINHFSHVDDTFITKIFNPKLCADLKSLLIIPPGMEKFKNIFHEIIEKPSNLIICNKCGENISLILEDILIAKEQPSRLDCVGD